MNGSQIKKGIHQGHLEDVVRGLFSGEYVQVEVRKGSGVVNPVSGAFLEFDLHLPQLNLVFEFQDAYHYVTTWDSQIPIQDVIFKDSYKASRVLEQGGTLVTVPCWWDGTTSSLVSSIRFQRPDLLSDHKTRDPPISLSPHSSFFQPGTIPGVGELMQASFPSGNAQFAKVMALSNPWWMGEKYDGVRFCWHPLNSTIYSRSGLEIEVPDTMIDRLSDVNCFMDGEAWFGRGYYQETQSLINMAPNELLWPYLRMIGFDMPTLKYEANEPVFEERYSQLLSSVPRTSPFVIVAHRTQLTKNHHLKRSIHLIIRDSGEGVILRRPHSIYEHGRSSSLIKLKATRVDKEALVVTNEENSAFTLQMPDGVKFTVPTKYFKTHTKCKKGDIVTITYDRYAQNSTPVNVRVVRIRQDVTWQSILSDYARSVPKPQFFNEITRKTVDERNKSVRVWSDQKKKSMRSFFEKISLLKNFDPLVPSGWYSLTKKYIKTLKGGSTVLDCFGGSYVKAVVHLFPEVSFDITKFVFPPRHYWDDVRLRRKFFENFAKENNFDPLLAINWYSIPQDQIMTAKNAISVLSYYNKNYKTALKCLFPELGLDKRFYQVPRTHWEKEENRKTLFLEFAHDNNFDPLKPHNWYSISPDDIINYKAGNYVLTTYYHGSFTEALQNLFPNLQIDISKFTYIPRKFWTQKKNRRHFFEDIAKDNGFNPLIPDSWYILSSDKIMARKGSHSVLYYYNGSIMKALVDLFPETKFIESKFSTAPRNYWNSMENRKNFFLDIATLKEFDPYVADNWYSLQLSSINSIKGLHSVLVYYKGNLSKALVHIFSELNLDESKFIKGR